MLRLIIFGMSVSFSLAVALHLSVLSLCWQATVLFMDQVLSLFWGPFCLRFCNPPYRQLAFLRSSQVTALESARQLHLPREAFLTTSLSPWVAGRVKLIFCTCAHPWAPSFLCSIVQNDENVIRWNSRILGLFNEKWWSFFTSKVCRKFKEFSRCPLFWSTWIFEQ